MNEIYITVFPHHSVLINLLERYGFSHMGDNNRGERVYIKNRTNLDFSDPYKSFPFIKRGFEKAYILPIDDNYHDTLFPYSELAQNALEVQEMAAGNGISKVFIGFPSQHLAYERGKPILVYRKHTGDKKKSYASCLTSFCTLTNIYKVKHQGIELLPLDTFLKITGNKTVFTETELLNMYYTKRNIVVVEMIYNGFFGKGHNITNHWLYENKLFNGYPYSIEYSEGEFIRILEEGQINVQNAVIN